jgi:hypothetical protein
LARDKSSDLVEDVFTFGEAHLISGVPGSGKTAFETWMCSLIMRGEPFLDRTTHCPPWWGAFVIDRGMQARHQFWEAAGLKGIPFQECSDPGAGIIPYYCLTEDPQLNPSSLRKMIRERTWDPSEFLRRKVEMMNPPKGGVLTIDVGNFFGSDAKGGYDLAFVSGWGVNKIATEFGITVIALMHAGKPKKLDHYIRLTDRVIAGTGFIGAIGTNSYITCYQETDDRGMQEFEWQSHYCPPARWKLKRTTEGLYEVVEQVDIFGSLAEKPGMPAGYSERWDVYLPWFPPEGATNYLPTMTIMQRALTAPLNFSKRTVTRDLEAMEQAGVIVRFRGERGKWQRKQQAEVGEGSEG